MNKLIDAKMSASRLYDLAMNTKIFVLRLQFGAILTSYLSQLKALTEFLNDKFMIILKPDDYIISDDIIEQAREIYNS